MIDFSSQLSRYERSEDPAAAPDPEDWAKLEKEIGFKFPVEFQDFYLQALGYHFEGELPSLFGKGTNGIDWLVLISREQGEAGVAMPEWLVPFCAVGNGDFHCFRRRQSDLADIVYWYGDKGPGQVREPRVLAEDFQSWLNGYVKDAY